MFKDMKVGTKIGLGFGALIVITLILGVMAVLNMQRAESDSTKLSGEFAPEVLMTGDMERRVYRTVYAMRGYNYTGDEQFFNDGLAAMAQVKETMAEGDELANKALHLTKLKGNLVEVKQNFGEYERLVGETKKTLDKRAQSVATILEAARTLEENSDAFLEIQQSALFAELERGASYEILKERYEKIRLMNGMIDQSDKARIAFQRARAERDNALLQNGLNNYFAKIDQIGQQLVPLVHQPQNKQQLNHVLAAAAAYKGATQQYLDAALELERLDTARRAVSNKTLELSRDLNVHASNEMVGIATDSSSMLSRAATVMIVGLALAVVLGVVVAFLITRGITTSITRVVDGLSEGAEQVAAASAQVSSASQNLAEGSSEQAASIEETSSSLEEMSSMTRQNADNANQANALMKEGSRVVAMANESMEELTRSMQEISTASEETSKIIKTIDEIAFQTNLLALNAAVEAARAGEAGAGFAVVADEVRNLAMRAADAAKNTANLIETTVKQVKEGADLVAHTNENFVEVAKSSAKVGELVSEIAAASSEQAQGISQVNTAVSEVDKVTQQNAANAEESASAAEEMNAQAEQMKGFVAELVAMVGAVSNGTDKRSTSSTGRRPASRGVKKTAGLHSLTSQKGRAKEAQPAAGNRKPSPEELIPLDQDFTDF